MSVNYEEAGDSASKTIIFVHGAGGSSATWFMQMRGLSSDFHIIAIELNGHGQTPDRGEEDVLHSYLHDIHEVVSKFDRPVLAGHSMGGALTQLYALYHPEYLRGIILVGTGAKLRVTPIVFNLLDNDFEGYVEAIGNFMFHEDTSEEMIETSKQEVRRCRPQIIKRDFELCDKFDIMDKVDQIKTPALIVVGDADVMTPVKYSTYLKDKIKDSKMSVIEEAGHLVMFEKFGVLNELVANWVRGLT
ncbi:MAG: alpha/beta fold hydrolase [Candidatus Thorarchaeota archaeon]